MCRRLSMTVTERQGSATSSTCSQCKWLSVKPTPTDRMLGKSRRGQTGLPTSCGALSVTGGSVDIA